MEEVLGRKDLAPAVGELPLQVDAGDAFRLEEFEAENVVAGLQRQPVGFLLHRAAVRIVDDQVLVDREAAAVVGFHVEIVEAVLRAAEDPGPARIEVLAQPGAVEVAGHEGVTDLGLDANEGGFRRRGEGRPGLRAGIEREVLRDEAGLGVLPALRGLGEGGGRGGQHQDPQQDSHGTPHPFVQNTPEQLFVCHFNDSGV